jgi:two-component system response regulator RegX3
MKPHILVVEDEPGIAEPLAITLERDGFTTQIAGTVAAAKELFHSRSPDLVLLDIMLPDGDGRDLCRDLRKESDVPIIMLTARGEELDKVIALELGADDYVVKPFSARELAARIRAILRRGRSRERRDAIEVGDIRLDPAARTVVRDGETIELTPREFDLLHMLMQNAGEVCRREDIMDEVWDPHWFGPTKTLDVHVSWLRKKLEENPGKPRYIKTVRGVGFRFELEDALQVER